MSGWLYLGTLVAGCAAMVLLDWRLRLFFWVDARRAAIVLCCGIALFVLWDVVGIASGAFARGRGDAMSGIEIWHEFPPEELVFITFFCYVTMVVRGIVVRVARGVEPHEVEPR